MSEIAIALLTKTMAKQTISIEIKREKNTVGILATCSSKVAADRMEILFERLVQQLVGISREAD